MAEYNALELREKATQRQAEILAKNKLTIMECLFNVAAKEGKTSYQLKDEYLIPEILEWLDNLDFTVNGNIVSW